MGVTDDNVWSKFYKDVEGMVPLELLRKEWVVREWKT